MMEKSTDEPSVTTPDEVAVENHLCTVELGVEKEDAELQYIQNQQDETHDGEEAAVNSQLRPNPSDLVSIAPSIAPYDP